jgi:hypothetical protein
MMDVEESDIKEVIKRWVEHTLQMEVKYTRSYITGYSYG